MSWPAEFGKIFRGKMWVLVMMYCTFTICDDTCPPHVPTLRNVLCTGPMHSMCVIMTLCCVDSCFSLPVKFVNVALKSNEYSVDVPFLYTRYKYWTREIVEF